MKGHKYSFSMVMIRSFVELIELAIEIQICLIELPAHTSHWLQPCDRTVYGPLKAYYNGACQDMMNACAGAEVSKKNFCMLLKTAWDKAMTLENIQSGFRTCGIFPFNPTAVPQNAYLPNSVYTVAHLVEDRELLDIIDGDQLPVEQEVITEGEESIAAAAVAVDEVAQQIQATHDFYDYLSPNPTVVADIMQAVPPKNALNALLTTISESQLAGNTIAIVTRYHFQILSFNSGNV